MVINVVGDAVPGAPDHGTNQQLMSECWFNLKRCLGNFDTGLLWKNCRQRFKHAFVFWGEGGELGRQG